MKRLIILFIFAIAALGARAQSHVDVAYSMGFGTGDLGDFISKPSFRGITFDYRYEVKPNIGLGLSLGWNTFYASESSQTYTIDNASLSGKQYRYSNNVPMLVTGTYFLNPDEFISPYAGLGLGVMYTRRNTDMNLYTLEQEAWNFALQPEVGVHFKTSDNVGFVVGLKYMHGFEAGSELPNAQSYFSLNVGFAFY